jgi:hypothetical protein
MLAETTGQTKEGMDIAHTGVWGYHPLVISLAQHGQAAVSGQPPRQSALVAAAKAAVLRMEFKAFLHVFILIPMQVVRTSRRLIVRLLAWNPWQAVFLRGLDHLRAPIRV